MKTCLLFCIYCFTTILLHAQNLYPIQVSPANKVEKKLSTQNTIDHYFETIQDHAVIYSSKLQEAYPRDMVNHPFFKTQSYTKGTLCFDGIVYSDVSLRLDLYKNELILTHPIELHSLVVENEYVDYVELHGYHILYYHSDGKIGAPASGYYMLLHNGACDVLRKEVCTQQQVQGEGKHLLSFNRKVEFFILKDGSYHMVNSKKSLLNVFKPHKKELEQYIRQQKLSFRNDAERAVVSVVKQYELLGNR